ncbi:MAG: HAD hydrolase family protein, partial [candidate division Zixibacteria bacterium]|nr:HAD hydrolase family protein [candidate division Zixibacteria bacterium]
RIKLLALDVDGVLTDDSIYFGPDGYEMKRFNISDGFFIVLAMRAGLEIAIVSGRYSPATDTRMKDLGVRHVLQGKKNKVDLLEPLLKELKIDFAQVAFIGNELLDIGLAKRVDLPIAVKDSATDYLDVVEYVTEHGGGSGAVREILEIYFEAIGKKPIEYVV